MARVIAAPIGNMFGKVLAGPLSQNTVNYLQQQIGTLANSATAFGQALYQRSMTLFNQVNSDEANRIAEVVMSQVDSLMGLDIIEPLLTVDLLQTAKPIMQGWIMTDPTIRQGWYDGKLEGYTDTYKDDQPGAVGHEHDKYRFLMNGVHVPHPTQSHQHSLYFDREHNPDTQMSMRNLCSILETQAAARDAFAAMDRDPTSQYNALL